jgi:fructose transport system ATP-binding protein
VDPAGEGMSEDMGDGTSDEPILEAKGLVKLFGRVVGLRGIDLTLYPGEILAVIGDNGAGKSTLIKCLSGAMQPDAGEIKVHGKPVSFRSTQDARAVGIETVYQTLAVAPALDIASNLYLAREIRRKGPLGSVLRMLDTGAMKNEARENIKSLGISTLQNISQAVETLSGGQRQAVAVARAATFGSKVVILDEPTAALGVRETNQVLRLVTEMRDRGIGVILISHNMPNVFETADRIQVQRLGGSAGVITPKSHSMQDAVAIMTGAMTLSKEDQTLGPAPKSDREDKADDTAEAKDAS